MTAKDSSVNFENDLKYKSKEVATKEEVNAVDAKVDAIVQTKFVAVDSLPATGESNTIYLVPKASGGTQNAKDEYIWVNNAWELIGNTEVDISGKQDKLKGYTESEDGKSVILANGKFKTGEVNGVSSTYAEGPFIISGQTTLDGNVNITGQASVYRGIYVSESICAQSLHVADNTLEVTCQSISFKIPIEVAGIKYGDVMEVSCSTGIQLGRDLTVGNSSTAYSATVNGKNILVEGDVDLSTYATKTEVNAKQDKLKFYKEDANSAYVDGPLKAGSLSVTGAMDVQGNSTFTGNVSFKGKVKDDVSFTGVLLLGNEDACGAAIKYFADTNGVYTEKLNTHTITATEFYSGPFSIEKNESSLESYTMTFIGANHPIITGSVDILSLEGTAFHFGPLNMTAGGDEFNQHNIVLGDSNSTTTLGGAVTFNGSLTSNCNFAVGGAGTSYTATVNGKNILVEGDVDLSNYATKDDVDAKQDKLRYTMGGLSIDGNGISAWGSEVEYGDLPTDMAAAQPYNGWAFGTKIPIPYQQRTYLKNVRSMRVYSIRLRISRGLEKYKQSRKHYIVFGHKTPVSNSFPTEGCENNIFVSDTSINYDDTGWDEYGTKEITYHILGNAPYVEVWGGMEIFFGCTPDGSDASDTSVIQHNFTSAPREIGAKEWPTMYNGDVDFNDVPCYYLENYPYLKSCFVPLQLDGIMLASQMMERMYNVTSSNSDRITALENAPSPSIDGIKSTTSGDTTAIDILSSATGKKGIITMGQEGSCVHFNSTAKFYNPTEFKCTTYFNNPTEFNCIVNFNTAGGINGTEFYFGPLRVGTQFSTGPFLAIDGNRGKIYTKFGTKEDNCYGGFYVESYIDGNSSPDFRMIVNTGFEAGPVHISESCFEAGPVHISENSMYTSGPVYFRDSVYDKTGAEILAAGGGEGLKRSGASLKSGDKWTNAQSKFTNGPLYIQDVFLYKAYAPSFTNDYVAVSDTNQWQPGSSDTKVSVRAVLMSDKSYFLTGMIEGMHLHDFDCDNYIYVRIPKFEADCGGGDYTLAAMTEGGHPWFSAPSLGRVVSTTEGGCGWEWPQIQVGRTTATINGQQAVDVVSLSVQNTTYVNGPTTIEFQFFG